MKTMILFILFFGFLVQVTPFVLSGVTSTPDDIQYLHLLLADEKAERMRLQTQVDRLESSLRTVQEQLEAIPGSGTAEKVPNVAFRTELSKDVGTVSANHVIIFDEVDLNVGNAYDVRHGTFTAPYNGTYLFSMALANPAGNPGAFFLKQNGQVIEFVFGGHASGGWTMGSITTVAELEAGDDVWIEGEGYISGAYAQVRYHTSFAGILVHNY